MKTMKTKTDYFTKFITFCVLALFLFTNMILFTSCDNGNSPNDNTNEEQNNTQNTDYCEICDGVQTENCGIEHKCNDENCVEYADKKIYKNGHTHDYCENNDCDGSTHEGKAHPEYESWFQEAKIGGENSNICPMYVTEYTVNENNKLTTESVNNILDQYKKYVNNLNLDTTLSDGQIDFEAIKAFTGANEPKKFDILISNINNVCAPAFRKFAQNVKLTGDKTLDQTLLKLYYRAFAIEGYNYGNDNNCNITYTTEKNNINKTLGNVNKANNSSYSIYNMDGTIHQEAIQNMGQMVKNIAEALNLNEIKVWNMLNFSWTTNTIEGLHDDLCEVNALGNDIIDHTASDSCKTNEMVNVITEVQLNTTAMISPAKLNKSIFSQDMGRELC